MGKINTIINGFNRGIISKLGLARVDLDRVLLSSEIQDNFTPRILGSQMLRPGYEYRGETYQDKYAQHIEFIYARDDKATLEFTDFNMRVALDDVIISRVAVATAITNGFFNTDLTGWTSQDETGSTSSWATGGYLSLVGTNYNAAIRRQQVTVSVGDFNKEHGINIVVERGPITIKVGSTAGGTDLIPETTLNAGVHSLAFTPSTSSFYVDLIGRTLAASLVNSCIIESAGDMLITTPWAEADLSKMRWEISGDVTYIACRGYKTRKIERHGTRSWSCVFYSPVDGPFRAPNTTTIRLTPSALNGDITLTASRDLFTSGNIGSLFRITSTGQNTSFLATADNQFSNAIRVTGVGAAQRTFSIVITGTFVGTITLQRSVGTVGAWVDVTTFAAPVSTTYADGLDNQIIYYRLGIKTGNYTSGSATLVQSYVSGGLTGICRVTGYTNAQSVTAAVLQDFGSTATSELWEEGEWSDRRGHPYAMVLHGGRMWLSGFGKRWGSVSDTFESFDDTVEGDSAPISGFIGSGGVSKTNWLLSLRRLVIGTETAEWIARSSSLDEPYTPTNFNLKDSTTQGSSAVPAVKVDLLGMYVQASGNRIFQLDFKVEDDDYKGDDITKLVPEIGDAGFVRLAVQRQPDTRVQCVRGDGTLALLVFDELESVKCWVTAQTLGVIEDVYIVPGNIGSREDSVYFCIKRTINGVTKRYRERVALESECVGGTLNKQADCFKTYTGSPVNVLTGFSHLEGSQVIVWGDGIDLSPDDLLTGAQKTYTVTGGNVTLDPGVTVSNAVVGLPYKAQYRSAKLSQGARLGTFLMQLKAINYLGLILKDTHPLSIKYGPDFNSLDPMPQIEDGAPVNRDAIFDEYDGEMFEFDGDWSTDSRVCLEAKAPRPCTILAFAMGVTFNEK